MFKLIRRAPLNKLTFRHMSTNMSTNRGSIEEFKLLTTTLEYSSNTHNEFINYLNDDINAMIKQGFQPENVVISNASTGTSGGYKCVVVVPMVKRQKGFCQ